jgi:hypothetical protein
VGDGRGGGRLLRSSERHPSCGLSYRHCSVAAGGSGKGEGGGGGGYQRQVDSDADESVVKAIRGAVERSERPFGWPSLGQSLTSSDLVLVVIPRKEGDQCAPYSLGVGPINCSQNPLPPTRAWCLVPVSPVIPVPATPCLAKTPVTRV